MRSLASTALIGLACAMSARAASADVITPQKILRIQFTTSSSYTPQPPDVLKLHFGLTNVISPTTARIASLFNGNALLATHSSFIFGGHTGPLNLDPTNSWKSASSVWTFDNPATADFTTIVNGTIQGRIDYTVATGAHDVPLNQISLHFIRATSGSGGFVVTPSPTITSIQVLDVGAGSPTPFCFGDGTGTPCPCGNQGTAGAGCSNSVTSGAVLTSTGSTSFSADDLVLTAQGLPPNQFGIVFVGDTQVSGGMGSPFFDGLLCVSGNVVRYPVQSSGASGSISQANPVANSAGLITGAGQTWNFQAWYRDVPAAFSPCQSGANFSNALEVTYTN